MERKKIVTIGGGTGSAVVLTGLKKYPVEISAIVSMADDGGSAGILRSQLKVLPPGDVRQCLVALSEGEDWLKELMAYRFGEGDLKGHTVGNLLLAALEKINGNFTKGAERLAGILETNGRVIPVSEELMTLQIRLKNGKILIGENKLDHDLEIREIGVEDIFLERDVSACEQALESIRFADMIVIGPGDMYGSVLPIFLSKGIVEEIGKSKAKVVFNCSLTNRKGQTDGFDLFDYVGLLEKRLGKGRIDKVIFNEKKIPDVLVRELEKKEGKGCVVSYDPKKTDALGTEIVVADVLSDDRMVMDKKDAIASTRSFIRHDSAKLAKILINILSE